MFREILVPLDGSRVAEAAIPVAAAIAARNSSQLHLVAVSRPLALTGEFVFTPEVPVAASAELDAIAREQLTQYVRRWEQTIAAADGLAIRSEVLDTPQPVAAQLFQYADQHFVDLIVMHTHARGVVGRMWLGSIAHALVQRGGVPCLLLRGPAADGEPGHAALPLRPRRILVPLDESGDAELGVDFALATAVEELTEIVLVSVLNPLPFPTGMLEREALVTQRTETDRYLAQVAERVAEQGFPVEAESLVHADTATAILEAVESHGADLVSIAAPQRSASDRLFLGSVINQLLRRSHIPMLVWRNRALAGTTLLPPRTAPSVEP